MKKFVLVVLSYLFFLTSVVIAQDCGNVCKGTKVKGTVTDISSCSSQEGEWCISCTASCKYNGESKNCPQGGVAKCPNGTTGNTVIRCFPSKQNCEKAVKDAKGLCPSDGIGQQICDRCIDDKCLKYMDESIIPSNQY
jgi:hypothetical protein